jgi:hypothetical protein
VTLLQSTQLCAPIDGTPIAADEDALSWAKPLELTPSRRFASAALPL